MSPFRIPTLFIKHFNLVRTRSRLAAPPATNAVDDLNKKKNNKFPILIYSHGFLGFRNINAFVCEELSSHGFVCAAVQHTFDSYVTVFPDGSIGRFRPNSAEDRKGNLWPLLNRQLEIRVNDIAFCLDVLTKIEEGSSIPFKILDQASTILGQKREKQDQQLSVALQQLRGRLDTQKIGIFGHSFGGATSILATHRFPERICACVVLDAWMWPLPYEVLGERFSSIPFYSSLFFLFIAFYLLLHLTSTFLGLRVF